MKIRGIKDQGTDIKEMLEMTKSNSLTQAALVVSASELDTPRSVLYSDELRRSNGFRLKLQ